MTNLATPFIRHLVIIGTGLIGGSFSLALQQAGCVARITGVGRGRSNLEQACKLGIIHDWEHDAARAVRDADLILLATPVATFPEIFARIKDQLSPDAIITDAGSTKQSVIADAHAHLVNLAHFVPAHPLAGTEKSGASAAFSSLFKERICILTPEEGVADPESVLKVQQWWQAAGSQVIQMDAVEHDHLLAAVSHLPHLAAYAVVNSVASLERGQHDPFQFAAGGFRDFTRIASSSPSMWRDIALCNREALLHKMDALQHELGRMRDALEAEDGVALLQQFETARDAREDWLKKYNVSRK